LPALGSKQLAWCRQLNALTHVGEHGRQAQTILAELRAWLAGSPPEVRPSTLTGKALVYLHNQRPKLIGYLDDGLRDIDNNPASASSAPS
jgi:hypothetical protein